MLVAMVFISSIGCTMRKNEDVDSSKEPQSASSSYGAGTTYNGPLPINDEFVALDAVKEYLGLEDYEQVANGSGGYTYCKGNCELGGNGNYILKEINEPFFLVSPIYWDDSMLSEGIYKPATVDDYAVLKNTGEIFPVANSDY